MSTDFAGLLAALADHNVEFVVVGGVALVLHGSARTTADLDICYSRDLENLERLAAALLAAHPRLRGAPAGLPFQWDARTLKSGLNFTLETDLGWIDLLGELTGLGGFEEVSRAATAMDLYGRSTLVLDLDGLERAKQAAGRLKDLGDLAEIKELKQKRSGGGA